MNIDKSIKASIPPSGAGCADCEALGSWWFHLRRCAECGHVGCCDESLNHHASSHAELTGHAIIQSYEPGEDWFYDFATDKTFAGPALAEPNSHPHDQSVPGPRARVPRDWIAQLNHANRG
ncbi:UBP-type zinc finger domain-containing protein [Gordonia sp. NPDC058843]|uniref:UBP-type zinc finger domain-containing protein n=1 Tax=Gordonia sp. NPDC058843 TaxID=3346648 RepID=UPI0036CC6994